MATVPFAERRTQIAPTADGRDTTRASDANIGEGLQKLGAGLAAAGEGAAAFIDRNKQTRLVAALSPLREAAGKRLNVLRSLRGGEVNEAAVKAFESDLETARQEFGKDLSSDERQRFDSKADELFSAARVDADGHRVREQKAYAENTRVAARDSAADSFAQSPIGQKAESDFSFALAAAWDPAESPEVNQRSMRAAASRAVGGAIDSLLRQENPDIDAAKKILDSKSRFLPEEVRSRAQQAVDQAVAKKEDNEFVAGLIQKVQIAQPADLENPDPSKFSAQEREVHKAILSDGALSPERREARVRRASAVIGDARSATIRQIQEDEQKWIPLMRAEGTTSGMTARAHQAPAYMQPGLFRLIDQQAAREAGKSDALDPKDDADEIRRRESAFMELLRAQVHTSAADKRVGVYQNQEALINDLNTARLPEEAKSRLIAAFQGGGELVKGVTVPRVEEAVKDILGDKAKDMSKEDINAMFLNVSAAWSKDKAYDALTLHKMVKAQLLNVRTTKSGDMRAFEAIRSGVEDTIDSVLDEDAVTEEAAAMRARGEEPDPTRVIPGNRAWAWNPATRKYDLPTTTGDQTVSAERAPGEEEMKSIISRRLGFAPGARLIDEQRKNAASYAGQVGLILKAETERKRKALALAEQRARAIMGGTADLVEAP